MSRKHADLRAAFASFLVGCVIAVGIIVVVRLVHLTNQIQQQRYGYCLDQNGRHDRTVSQLNAIISQAEKGQSPKRVVQLKTSQAQTLLLINDLAPKQVCTKP